jgi:putative NIF3 family GTP cyclohydrolase 1 type 2
VTQIAEAVELIAPLALAEGWDNCGLQVGDPKEEVNRVLVALTPLPEVFEEAEKRGADFLLFHHPLIFDPLKAIVTSSYPGGLLARAIRNGHAVYAAHTSYDAAPAGVSVALARALGLGGPLRVLSPSFVEGFLTARVSQEDSMNRSSSCLVGRARMAP